MLRFSMARATITTTIFEGTVEEVGRLVALHGGGSTPGDAPPGKSARSSSDRLDIIPFVTLTPAQYAVAECVIEGMSTPQIAASLQCAESTVKTHRRAIRKALGESECEELKVLKARWWRG